MDTSTRRFPRFPSLPNAAQTPRMSHPTHMAYAHVPKACRVRQQRHLLIFNFVEIETLHASALAAKRGEKKDGEEDEE